MTPQTARGPLRSLPISRLATATPPRLATLVVAAAAFATAFLPASVSAAQPQVRNETTGAATVVVCATPDVPGFLHTSAVKAAVAAVSAGTPAIQIIHPPSVPEALLNRSFFRSPSGGGGGGEEPAAGPVPSYASHAAVELEILRNHSWVDGGDGRRDVVATGAAAPTPMASALADALLRLASGGGGGGRSVHVVFIGFSNGFGEVALNKTVAATTTITRLSNVFVSGAMCGRDGALAAPAAAAAGGTRAVPVRDVCATEEEVAYVHGVVAGTHAMTGGKRVTVLTPVASSSSSDDLRARLFYRGVKDAHPDVCVAAVAVPTGGPDRDAVSAAAAATADALSNGTDVVYTTLGAPWDASVLGEVAAVAEKDYSVWAVTAAGSYPAAVIAAPHAAASSLPAPLASLLLSQTTVAYEALLALALSPSGGASDGPSLPPLPSADSSRYRLFAGDVAQVALLSSAASASSPAFTTSSSTPPPTTEVTVTDSATDSLWLWPAASGAPPPGTAEGTVAAAAAGSASQSSSSSSSQPLLPHVFTHGQQEIRSRVVCGNATAAEVVVRVRNGLLGGGVHVGAGGGGALGEATPSTHTSGRSAPKLLLFRSEAEAWFHVAARRALLESGEEGGRARDAALSPLGSSRLIRTERGCVSWKEGSGSLWGRVFGGSARRQHAAAAAANPRTGRSPPVALFNATAEVFRRCRSDAAAAAQAAAAAAPRVRLVGLGVYVSNLGGVDMKAGTFYADFNLYTHQSKVRYRTVAEAEAQLRPSPACSGDAPCACPELGQNQWEGYISPNDTGRVHSVVNLVNVGRSRVVTPVLRPLGRAASSDAAAAAAAAPRVVEYLRVQATLHFAPQLRRWPMDEQHLGVVVEDVRESGSEEETLRFCHMEASAGLSPEARYFPGMELAAAAAASGSEPAVARRPAWGARVVRACWPSMKHPRGLETCAAAAPAPGVRYASGDASCTCLGGTKASSRYTFAVRFERPALSSLLKACLPAAFIVVVNEGVWFLHPKVYETRLSVCGSSLISGVMYHVSLASFTPDHSVLTWADRFMAVVYANNVLAFVAVFVQTTLHQGDCPNLAFRSFRFTRVWGPLTAVGTFAGVCLHDSPPALAWHALLCAVCGAFLTHFVLLPCLNAAAPSLTDTLRRMERASRSRRALRRRRREEEDKLREEEEEEAAAAAAVAAAAAGSEGGRQQADTVEMETGLHAQV